MVFNRIGREQFSHIIMLISALFLYVFQTPHDIETIVSVLIFLFTLVIWWQILKQLEFSGSFITSAILVMLLSETYLGLINSTIFGVLAFMFAALSFFLFVRRLYFIAPFALFAAAACHPVGFMGFFYCAACGIAYPQKALGDSRTEKKRTRILLTYGSFAGILMYLFLRMDYVMYIYYNFAEHFGGGFGNYIFTYFSQPRHMVEFVIFAGAAGLFVTKKMWQDAGGRFLSALLVCVFVSSLVFFMGGDFMPFGYFAFVFIMIAVAERYGKLWMLNLLWVVMAAALALI